MKYPLPRDFRVRFEDLRIVARGLNRPECVLALSDGHLVAAHGSAGYSIIDTGGHVTHTLIDSGGSRRYVPNGIAVSKKGEVLFADLGAERGGVFSIGADGSLKPLVESIDGAPLPPSNFVLEDDAGRLWFTVSTRLLPRTAAWSHQVADGFIAVADDQGVRIVADNLGYTNEIAFSPDGQWVYVNETYNQRTSRFALLPGASLGPKEVLVNFEGADFPDGLTFDQHGGLWITCIGSNRLVVLRPDDASLQTVLEDTDHAYAEKLAERLRANLLSQEDMRTAGRSRLGNISSLAFGGPSRSTAYLGCLLDDCIRSFESPVPGLAPAHWNRSLTRNA
ncbi:MAG TPA: SMP-30/gluconolactonase/LRE family protein [Paraburkholderia sp.]|jgi:sugar lactone lactonase YvrE